MPSAPADLGRLVPCRCCGAPGARVLHQGVLAPFFAKRVLGIQVASFGDRARRPRKRSVGSALRKGSVGLLLGVLGATSPGRRLVEARAPITAWIRVCATCGFVGPDVHYSDEQLLNLYADYRSESYDTERVFLEPSYRRIRRLVGKGQAEVEGRLENVGRLLRAHLDLRSIAKVLDWGGGEGTFVPRELRDRQVFVLDVSSEALIHDGLVRIDQPPSDVVFDYIQVCHLLEHVVSPLRFLEKVLVHLKPGGCLYVEVPQDRSDEEVQGLVDARPELTHTIHEHLNLFTSRSIRALAGALDLREVAVEVNSIDLGWTNMKVISGLFAKP